MSIRARRLGEVIKKDLVDIITREYQPDGTFVTITQVRLTPDLSIAKVYLSVYSPGRDEITIFEQIDKEIDTIRFKLASKIKNQVRKIPELHFYVDDTAEYVDKIESLFKKVEIKTPPTSDEEE